MDESIGYQFTAKFFTIEAVAIARSTLERACADAGQTVPKSARVHRPGDRKRKKPQEKKKPREVGYIPNPQKKSDA